MSDNDIPLSEQIAEVRVCVSFAEDTVYSWRHRQNTQAYRQAKRKYDALQAAHRTLTNLQNHMDEAAAL